MKNVDFGATDEIAFPSCSYDVSIRLGQTLYTRGSARARDYNTRYCVLRRSHADRIEFWKNSVVFNFFSRIIYTSITFSIRFDTTARILFLIHNKH